MESSERQKKTEYDDISVIPMYTCIEMLYMKRLGQLMFLFQ